MSGMNGRTDERELLAQVLCKEYEVRGQSLELRDAVEILANPSACADSDDAREQLKRSVERLSGNRNTVLYDEAGYPSVMVRIPAMRCRDVLASSENDAPHPAFLVGQRTVREVYVGKYLGSMVNGHLCSLPLARPYLAETFDLAADLCYRKGHGWMMTPFALWMAIALTCRRNGFFPNGGNDNGADYYHPEEKGKRFDETGRVLTGSGPVTWSHDWTADGLWDMNGNLNEWSGGFRLKDGELQFVEPCELTDASSMADNSGAWHAVDALGRAVAPNSPGTLHYDVKDGGIRLVVEKEYEGVGNCSFGGITVREGLAVPEYLKLCGLCPEEGWKTVPNEGWRWIDTQGEFLPLCGGAYRAVDHAGVFFAGMTKPRDIAYTLAGVRCAYMEEAL